MTDDTGAQNSFCGRKPDISYPCPWEYTIIGEDEAQLREIILAACDSDPPSITLSNVSSSGKYVSLKVTLLVQSEEMRLAIFDRIQKNLQVKMVI